MRPALLQQLKARPLWKAVAVLLISIFLMLGTIHLTLREISNQQMQINAQELSRIISGIRLYYANNVVQRIQEAQGQAVLSDRYREVHGGIPIPATLSIELGAIVSQADEQGTMAYRFVSDYPFASRAREPLDEFEREALETFRRYPETQTFSRANSPWWGASIYRIASPVKMTAVCVACHNQHPDSPKTNWQVGDVRGLQSVEVRSFQSAGLWTFRYVLLFLLFVVAGSTLVIVVFRRKIEQIRLANAELSATREREQAATHQLQEKIAELKLLAAVVDGSTFGVTIADARQPDHPLVYANEAFYAMTGLNPSRVIGNNCRFLKGPQTDPETTRQIRQAVQQGRRFVTEILNYRSNGAPFWNRLTLFPVGGSPGQPDHIVGYQSDITLNREAESERQRMIVKLQETMAAAEQASKTKTDFLALMSHELRTPMSGVIGMLGLVLKESLETPVKEKVSIALKNAQTLLTILNDLLDIAKIEAGKLTLESIDFHLEDLVKDTTTLLNELAEAKGTHIEMMIAPEVPTYLRGDPTRIRQVLINLLGNAVKFTESGSIRIEVRRVEIWSKETGLRSGQGTNIGKDLVRLRCEVSDTGIGMSEEARSRLFQRFEQADTSTTRTHGGTGLGLSICKSLVELMGGWIDVRTRLGQGTTFFFEVNLKPGQAPQAEAPEDLEPHSVCLNILVAEDGLTNQMVIESILRDMGHRVTIVENGELALEALLRQPFDVVLMDGRMPVMNGHEATQHIRSGHWGEAAIPHPDIPVIALTANAASTDREAFIAAGADTFLTKPIDEVQLHKALSEVIARRML